MPRLLTVCLSVLLGLSHFGSPDTDAPSINSHETTSRNQYASTTNHHHYVHHNKIRSIDYHSEWNRPSLPTHRVSPVLRYFH